MNEALQIPLEKILQTLHGKNLHRIIQATQKCAQKPSQKNSDCDQYIW